MYKFVIVLIVIAACTSTGADYSLVDRYGKKTTIKPLVLNQKEYLPLNRYYKAIFPNSYFNSATNTIKTGTSTIRITPATFYLLYTAGGYSSPAQMNLPALRYSGDLLVPLRSFFLSLNQFPGFSVSVKDNVINMADTDGKDILTGEVTGGEFQKTDERQPVLTKKKKPVKETEIQEPEHEPGYDQHESQNDEPEIDHDTKKPEPKYGLKNTVDESQATAPVLARSFNFTSAGFADKLDIIAGLDQVKKTPLQNKEIPGKQESPQYKENIIDLSYPPNLYVIPKNLIRKELEDMKTKDVKN